MPNPWDEFVNEHSNAAQLAGFDKHNPTSESLSRFWERVGTDIEALARLGAGIRHLGEPVEDHQLKFKLMTEHLQSGRSWVSVEDELDIPWGEQVRIISNGRPSNLYEWYEEKQISFEEDVRDGLSIRRLEKKYDLSYKQTRRLVAMFRGPREV